MESCRHNTARQTPVTLDPRLLPIFLGIKRPDEIIALSVFDYAPFGRAREIIECNTKVVLVTLMDSEAQLEADARIQSCTEVTASRQRITLNCQYGVRIHAATALVAYIRLAGGHHWHWVRWTASTERTRR
ncbi:hypothetical protein ScPMuIL_013797 [Solemya velum]